MKKKFIAIVLVLALVVSCFVLAACNSEEKKDNSSTFAKTVNAAIQKNRELDSIVADLSMELSMSTEGMSFTIPMNANIKIVGAKTESPVLSTVLSTSMFGLSSETETYQEGEWAYIVDGDNKYKTKAENIEEENDYANSINEMLVDIPEDWFEDAKITEGKDSITIDMSIPEEKFLELFGDYVEDLDADMESMEDVEISDAVISITLKGDYVSSYNLQFGITASSDGMTSSVNAVIGLTFINPGEQVEIVPPDGYQSFEEKTGSEDDFDFNFDISSDNYSDPEISDDSLFD